MFVTTMPLVASVMLKAMFLHAAADNESKDELDNKWLVVQPDHDAVTPICM
jgi:hypothetical protein